MEQGTGGKKDNNHAMTHLQKRVEGEEEKKEKKRTKIKEENPELAP